MGKNPNTFQKRQREFEKKRKAEDKRKRRQAQKDAPPVQTPRRSPKQTRQTKSQIPRSDNNTLTIRTEARGEWRYGH